MKIQTLRWFMVLADELHFGRAAQRIPVSVAALSTAIRRLEGELGVELIDRSRRAIELTAPGEELVDHAAKLIASHDRTIEVVQSKAQPDRRRLRVGVFVGGQDELLPAILRSFAGARSNTQVEVVPIGFTGQLDSLHSGAVDLSIVRPPYRDSGLQFHDLYSEPVVAMLGARNELADADVVAVDDLLDAPFTPVPGVDPTWHGYWNLDDVRGEPARLRSSKGVFSVLEMAMAIGDSPTAAGTTATVTQRNTFDPAVVFRPIDDPDRRSLVSIASNPEGPAGDIDHLVSAARRVVSDLIDLIPDARVEQGGPALADHEAVN